MVKGIQGNLKVEDKWFERVATNVRTPCSSLVIGYTIVKRFKYLIQSINPRFLYSDFCLLVGQHWLTFALIGTFVKIFNRRESNFNKIYSCFYLVDLETNGMLKEEIIDWKVK